MRAISDKELVKLCVDELCTKMRYIDRSKISQSDLEHLCYLIEENTKIVISVSTLKRIFVEKFERLPQAATLDALTKFLGYLGWQDFKTRKINSGKEEVNLAVEPAFVERKSTTLRNLVRVASAIVMMALLLSMIF